MIIEPYKTTADGEEVSQLFIRYRDEEGLIEEHVPYHECHPYFFIDASEDIDRLTDLYNSRFEGWSWGTKEATAKDGRELKQVVAHSPTDVRGMRELAHESWEADIGFADRYCIDNYKANEFPDWYDYLVKLGGFDLEWNTKNEITAMGFITDGEVMQWAWHPLLSTFTLDKSDLKSAVKLALESALYYEKQYGQKGSGRYQHNQMNGSVIGTKSEYGVYRWLSHYTQKEVQPLFQKQNPHDLMIGEQIIEVKALKDTQWDSLKRGIPPTQLEKYVKKNALVIWATTTADQSDGAVEIKGWNWASDVKEKGEYRKTICDNIMLNDDNDMRDIPSLLALFNLDLHLFNNEKEMLEDFASSFAMYDPDLITTWSGNRADWPMIYKRYKHYDLDMGWLSPITQESDSPPMAHLPRDGVYNEGSQMLLGRMTLDLADRNHGFERVWKDSGNGQLSDRRLAAVGQLVFPDEPERWKVDMKGMTHEEMWLNDFEHFLIYHRGDILLTNDIEESYHVARFFLALQRVCGVPFKSVFTVSKFARGLLRRRASWKAPTGSFNKGSHKSYGGGFVAEPTTGRHQSVGVFDFRAMYAEIQRGNNISPETQREGPGDDIKELDNGTFWYQGKRGVLPQLQMDLADARNHAKANMRLYDPSSKEYAGFNTLQLAFKRAAASVYGLMGHTGHGECDMAVASTITHVGRQLVSRLMEMCDEMGYEALAGHTDSAYIAIGDTDGEAIARELTSRIQKEFGSKRFVVEYEKHMKSWVAAKKNRNFGWVTWPKEGLHCTGFEMKKSNSSPLTKDIQQSAFEALTCENANQQEINDIIYRYIKLVRNGKCSIDRVTMRSRLGKHPESYDNAGGFQGAARFYNNLHPKDRFRGGDSVPYIYGNNGILAFKTDDDKKNLQVNWTEVINKQILSPVSLIYEAMNWPMPDASGARAKPLW